MSVGDMIAAGLLERVARDDETAHHLLADAQRHIATARGAVETDPSGAYQLAYDAARKAVAAHLSSSGLRVRRGEGAHVLTAQYAQVAIDGFLGERLEAMRRRRNRVEYGVAFIRDVDVQDALEVASALIAEMSRA